MFHILGFLFVIIVVILVIGLSIIGTVLRTIFGLGGSVVLPPAVINLVKVILTQAVNNQTLLHKPMKEPLLKEIIFIENTKNSSLKMKESMWILKKLKNNQTSTPFCSKEIFHQGSTIISKNPFHNHRFRM